MLTRREVLAGGLAALCVPKLALLESLLPASRPWWLEFPRRNMPKMAFNPEFHARNFGTTVSHSLRINIGGTDYFLPLVSPDDGV